MQKTASGWTLNDLDGMVVKFSLNGHWLSTADRYGNSKTATYSGSELISVTIPDGRREDFTYLSGKVRTITEIGVDGSTSRTWTYTWTGDNLTRIDRPDGTALEYLYDDPNYPGYLTRITLIGMDGTSERITAAFEYDAQGNTVKMWRGHLDFANGVNQWQFAFDEPFVPTVTTITDPLGNTFTRTWATRDFVTDKAKLTSVDGDCPTCGLGPNSRLEYNDPVNPFRVTDQYDARGTLTQFVYDADGMVTRRIEAFGTPLERETTWTYNSPFPALVETKEEPSTAGVPNVKLTTHTYNASGDRTGFTVDGFEEEFGGGMGLQAFSLTTHYGHNDGGRVTSIDPPGFGTDDVTSFTHDPTRGNGFLVIETRTDPIIGTTTYG